MVQKTVLKVSINCLKCKQQLLKAVSALQGVDKVEVDEVKGTLTVTGDADPYDIIVRTRKTVKFAEVVSIGPPPAPPKQDGQKKPADEEEACRTEEARPEASSSVHTLFPPPVQLSLSCLLPNDCCL
ncbi:hypothetical protein I3760_07G047400 [Carya illinoinensis]|nr:hypothetical protein I3760_07G047400 [Carya illinoinensis]